MVSKTTGYISPIAIHPGETLKELLETLNMSQKDLSIRTGLSERTVSEIIQGKGRVTLESALKFERVLGTSRNFWIKYQAEYDSDLLRLKEKERLKNELKLLTRFSFYNNLCKLGYVVKTLKKNEKIEELLRFFSINSLSAVKKTYPIAYNVAYRKSENENLSQEALAAWLRIGEIEAQKIETQDYNENELKNCLQEMRALTKEEPEIYSEKLKQICAKCGIALVYTPHLPKTYVNGATKWLSSKKALIQLSLRYPYSDSFWFTFFHEIGHIIRHGKKGIFVDLKKKNNTDDEQDADRFAENTLIPKKDFTEFIKHLQINNLGSQIRQFADKMGIDTGIVAGRLGMENYDWSLLTPHRKRLKFVKE